MQDFAAIDFETANAQRSSICSVGVVVVRGGEIADRFYSLVRPTPNYYSWFCTRVHGLRLQDTQSAPGFPEVWGLVDEIIGELPLVAHNKAFDENCLKAAHAVYEIPYPDYTFYCTLIASRRHLPLMRSHGLEEVAAACGHIMTNHHNALADAEACAAIALQLL